MTNSWNGSIWGSLGPPGSRTKEAIWRKVCALGHPRETAIEVAKRAWAQEMAVREGRPFDHPPESQVAQPAQQSLL